jgi:hypothetical protein
MISYYKITRFCTSHLGAPVVNILETKIDLHFIQKFCP